jgi:hypothetical protein
LPLLLLFPCCTQKLLSLKSCCPTLQWEDPSGRQRLWESAERTTRRGEVDGVAIVARVGAIACCSFASPLLKWRKQGSYTHGWRPRLCLYSKEELVQLPASLPTGRPCPSLPSQVVSKGQPPLLPVLKQYRPPLAAYCLELPAGLVDAGESAGEAAVRELREETGVYDGTTACVLGLGVLMLAAVVSNGLSSLRGRCCLQLGDARLAPACCAT